MLRYTFNFRQRRKQAAMLQKQTTQLIISRSIVDTHQHTHYYVLNIHQLLIFSLCRQDKNVCFDMIPVIRLVILNWPPSSDLKCLSLQFGKQLSTPSSSSASCSSWQSCWQNLPRLWGSETTVKDTDGVTQTLWSTSPCTATPARHSSSPPLVSAAPCVLLPAAPLPSVSDLWTGKCPAKLCQDAKVLKRPKQRVFNFPSTGGWREIFH